MNEVNEFSQAFRKRGGRRMVKLLRIDDRLLHGQVAFSWTNSLGVDAIIVANDEVVNDPIIKMSLKMATPPDVKLAIRSIEDAITLIENPKTKNMSIFVVVKNSTDAVRLAERTEMIKNINIEELEKKKESKCLLEQYLLMIRI